MPKSFAAAGFHTSKLEGVLHRNPPPKQEPYYEPSSKAEREPNKNRLLFDNDNDSIVVTIKKTKTWDKFSFRITDMTPDELEAFSKYINHAVEIARPICASNQEGLENERVDYRIPEFYVTEWGESRHDQSVSGGPDSSGGLGGTDPSGEGNPGANGEAVDERASFGVGAHDGGAKAK